MPMVNHEIRRLLMCPEQRAGLSHRVDEAKLEELDLRYLEISRGCGERICRIWHVNGQKTTSPLNSMPFEVIQKVHRSAYKSHRRDPDNRLAHFYRNEPPLWQDGVRDYSDVVKDAVDVGWNVCLRTHGRLPEDEQSALAILNLKNLFRKNPQVRESFSIEFSIDPYGWEDFDLDYFLQVTKSNLSELYDPFYPDIAAYFNSNDTSDGPGGKPSLYRILQFVLPPDYLYDWNSKINIFRLDDSGRAGNLFPKPEFSFRSPWQGDLITFDGQIMSASMSPTIGVGNKGSIYRGAKGTVDWHD